MTRVLIASLIAGFFACSLALPFKEKLGEKNVDMKHSPDAGRDGFLGRPMPADEGESRGTFETDIKLNPEQKEALQGHDGNSRSKRKATKDTTLLWTNNIVYYQIVSSQFSASEVNSINQAIQHWEKNTCIDFQTWNGNSNQPYISIQKLDGCWSYVGKQGSKQDVSIGTGCFHLGTVAHELGHAIGFWHEQSRTDRNTQVRVNWDNVQSGFENNFYKYTDEEIMTDVEYDVTSVMHYSSNGFQKDTNLPTLLPKDLSKLPLMGQRDGLSFLDIKLANRLYSCDDNCDGADTCQNGGFRLKNCSCKCPDNWSGTTCQTAKEVASEAETVVIVEGSGEIVSHAAYYSNADYSNNFENFTLLKAGSGKEIQLTFQAFDVEASSTCLYDFVEIIGVDGHPFKTTKKCGNQLPESVTANEIMIHFKTDYSQTKKGYRATYSTQTVSKPTTCPTLSDDAGFTGSCTKYVWLEPGTAQRIASPGYPGNYPIDTVCDYAIESTNKSVTIDIEFDSFSIEQNYDYLDVTYYDTTGRHTQKFDGSTVPVLSGSYQMIALKFYSDNMVTDGGFKATVCAHY